MAKTAAKKFPAEFEKDWPAERLDAMRDAGDVLADQTIQAILAVGDRDLVNSILPLLHQPDQWPPQTPPELKLYLDHSETLPAWADAALLERASKFMTAHAVGYNLTLIFLSLPILSAWQVGAAQTLTLTGQLTDHFARRISETLRFVLAVIAENGMSANGTGIRTTQKVRLMHATIRHFAHGSKCPDGSNYWNPKWGQAINQETLTATMLAFSTVNLKGMRKLEFNVTADDEVAVLHLWKVIGHILGIEYKDMPRTVEEAHLLWDKCMERNFGHSNAAVVLTKAHIAFVRSLAEDDPLLSAFLGDADESMMRFLMGRKIAVKMLGVPRPGLVGRVVDWVRRVVFRQVDELIDKNKHVKKLLDQHSEDIMKLVQLKMSKVTDSRPFAIPSKETALAGLKSACAMNKADTCA